jgi:hypothetical protein
MYAAKIAIDSFDSTSFLLKDTVLYVGTGSSVRILLQNQKKRRTQASSGIGHRARVDHDEPLAAFVTSISRHDTPT